MTSLDLLSRAGVSAWLDHSSRGRPATVRKALG